MFVIIDIGNTVTKVATFDQNQVSEMVKLKDHEIMPFLNKFKLNKGIVSTVRNADLALRIQRICPYFLLFNSDLKLPIEMDYKTFGSLGKDRIANVVAAHFLYPKKSNLVIDLGTCITYDFIDNSGVFQGGAISPGIELRYKSLKQHTASLPLVNRAKSTPNLIGKSTEESIQSGIENGIFCEVKEFINHYKAIFKELNVLITGGDSLLLNSIVEYEKNGIFAVENLTLLGLNQILKENVKV